MLYDWRYILAESPINYPPREPLVKIAEIDRGKGKDLDFGLNRSGSAKTTISLLDEISEYVFSGTPRRGTIRRSIIAMRGTETIWSGPIFTIDGGAPELTMNLNAVGWFEFLNYRKLSDNLNFIGDNPETGQPWNDAEIAFALLEEANTQFPGYPTPISKGSVHGIRQDRERKYTKGESIGSLIHDLSQIENGFDYEIDPITRELNIYGAGSGKGIDRPNVHYGYYFGPSNLEKVTFNEDGTSVRNRMNAYGDQGTIPALAFDSDSQDQYGIFEDTATLTNIKDSNILLAYAGGEIAVRAFPKLTYNIIPFSWHRDLNLPRIFEDFTIGDRGRFSFNAGAASVIKQPVRFYGASISISDDDSTLERITKLEVSPE